jgi:enoyl-CoA hydratase/carnithine racemase
MAYKTINVERKGPAGIITLNRPDKLNALSQELIGEVIAALGELDIDDTVRGIIITGSEKAFSTGADLNDGIKMKTLPDTFRYQQHQRRLTEAVERNSKPVIAAVAGYCLTGGFELALACDIRIAAENAQFGITSSKIGSVAGLGGTQRLPRLIGAGRAKELLFTADFIDAREADRIGLLNRLVPLAELMPEALRLVSRFAERAPLSIWLMKRAVDVGMNVDLESALSFEGHCTALSFTTADRAEGWNSFLQKRPVRFTGV